MDSDNRKMARKAEQSTDGFGHDVVVFGASMGGIPALKRVLNGLPAGLPASLFIVQHTSPYAKSHLAEVLSRDTALPTRLAIDGEPIENGRVYIAPSNRHLLLVDGSVRLVFGPRENYTRPAINPLFRSAAVAYGPRVVGVVLSGMLDDGTAGLVAVHRCGGVGIVQDPRQAEYPEMPASAAANDHPDYRLPLGEIAPTLVRLAAEPAGQRGPVPQDLLKEMEALVEFSEEPATVGEPASLGCPECGGPLTRVQEPGQKPNPHYRCHVGHSYTAKSLLKGQGGELERTGWTMYRLIVERRKLLGDQVEKARARGRPRLASAYEDQLARLNTMGELALEVLRLSEGH